MRRPGVATCRGYGRPRVLARSRRRRIAIGRLAHRAGAGSRDDADEHPGHGLRVWPSAPDCDGQPRRQALAFGTWALRVSILSSGRAGRGAREVGWLRAAGYGIERTPSRALGGFIVALVLAAWSSDALHPHLSGCRSGRGPVLSPRKRRCDHARGIPREKVRCPVSQGHAYAHMVHAAVAQAAKGQRAAAGARWRLRLRGPQPVPTASGHAAHRHQAAGRRLQAPGRVASGAPPPSPSASLAGRRLRAPGASPPGRDKSPPRQARQRVRGNPRSTFDVPGSGQRAVTILARV